MFRINNKFAGKIFLTLLYWRDQFNMNPQGGNRIRESALSNWLNGELHNTKEKPEWSRTTQNVFDIMTSEDFEFDSNKVLDDLSTQINQQANSRGHESDLIETFVKILKTPRGLNILSGKTLDQLRKAILLPDELAGLKQRLQKEELHCGSCGSLLHRGEMLTLGVESGGGVIVSCGTCIVPRLVKCWNNKEHVVELSPSLRKSIEKTCKSKCATCDLESKTKEDEIAVEPGDPDASSEEELELDSEPNEDESDEFYEPDDDGSPFSLDEADEPLPMPTPVRLSAADETRIFTPRAARGARVENGGIVGTVGQAGIPGPPQSTPDWQQFASRVMSTTGTTSSGATLGNGSDITFGNLPIQTGSNPPDLSNPSVHESLAREAAIQRTRTRPNFISWNELHDDEPRGR